MKFASSRTLPGHGLFIRASMVALGMRVIVSFASAASKIRHKIVNQERNVLAHVRAEAGSQSGKR